MPNCPYHHSEPYILSPSREIDDQRTPRSVERRTHEWCAHEHSPETLQMARSLGGASVPRRDQPL